MRQNLYRIDDVLLRAGSFTVLLILGAVFCLLTVGPRQGPVGLRGYEPLLAVGALCPVALFWAGLTMRSRERRTAALWNLLQQNAEIHVPQLIANSDFARKDLDQAIRFLNNRGLGHYVWDQKSDTLHDARLGSLQFHVERCEVCGASISVQVPLNFREIPSCPYCKDPVSVDSLAERRREALESLRVDRHPEPARDPAPEPGFRPGPEPTLTPSATPFSIPVFIVLMLVFWPAGLGYAWYRWQRVR